MNRVDFREAFVAFFSSGIDTVGRHRYGLKFAPCGIVKYGRLGLPRIEFS